MFLTIFFNQDCSRRLNYVIFISFTGHGDLIRCGCIFCEFDFLLDHRKDFTFNVSLCKIITRNLSTCVLHALTKYSDIIWLDIPNSASFCWEVHYFSMKHWR